MTRNRALLVTAVVLTVVQAAFEAGQVVLDQMVRPDPGLLGSDLFGALTVIVFPAVGLVVLRRYPRHAVGWLFVLANVPWTLNSICGAWARYAVLGGHALPGTDLAVWLYPWQGDLGFGLTIALLFFFPTGTLPSRRWRPALWVLGAVMVAGAAIAAFAPGRVDPTIGFAARNPLGAGGGLGGVLAALVPWQFAAFMIPLALGVAAIGLRFARSRGLERQQMKWFMWAAGIFGALLVAGVLTAPLGDTSNAFWTIALVELPLLPVSAAIGVLRYRLYDIDLVINRTLVYGSLSVSLGAVYAAAVLGFQAVLAPLGRSDALGIAASTLLVAALFQPFRRRLQSAVDRRFYRRRYDATREIATFGARLRDEVEPERLAEAIVATLERTVEPAGAGVWLRMQR